MRRVAMLARVAVAAGLLAACAEGPTAAAARGDFEGEWDGASWRGSAFAVLENDTLTVTAHRPDPQYFYDEYVTARVRFTGPGTYAVAEGRLSKIVGGDAGSAPDAAGTLVIERYDAAERTIRGELTLRASSVQPAWNARGVFNAPVYPNAYAVPPQTR